MSENQGSKVARTVQEPPKMAQRYRVTCGMFKERDKAIQQVAEAKRSGINVALTIKDAKYTLLYSENMTKEEAEAAKRVIEARKIKADVSVQ